MRLPKRPQINTAMNVIQVGDRGLISLRKHDAATLSALLRGPLAPHFAGPFVVLKQTARNAFQLDLHETTRRAHVHDVFNVSQPKKYHSAPPKIDSLESDADSLGNWDKSSCLDTAEPATDQPPVPPDEVHRVLEPSAADPRQPRARIAPKLSGAPAHTQDLV